MQDLKDCMSYLRQRMFAMEGWKLEDTPNRIYLGPQPKTAGDSGAGTDPRTKDRGTTKERNNLCHGLLQCNKDQLGTLWVCGSLVDRLREECPGAMRKIFESGGRCR